MWMTVLSTLYSKDGAKNLYFSKKRLISHRAMRVRRLYALTREKERER